MSAGRPGKFKTGVRACLTVVAGALLATSTLVAAPAAHAMTYGNYLLNIQGRFDFHTYIWQMGPTTTPGCSVPSCIQVSQRNQPIAKAFDFTEQARLADGRWTMVVEDPFGLRCGNLYYGPTIQTHDVYSWDAATMAGTLESSFGAGCDGAPGGTLSYPIWLVRQ